MDVISENNQITLYPDYFESKRIFSENKNCKHISREREDWKL